MKKTMCLVLALVAVIGLMVPALTGCRDTAAVELVETDPPLAESPVDEPEPVTDPEPEPVEPTAAPVVESTAAPVVESVAEPTEVPEPDPTAEPAPEPEDEPDPTEEPAPTEEPEEETGDGPILGVPMSINGDPGTEIASLEDDTPEPDATTEAKPATDPTDTPEAEETAEPTEAPATVVLDPASGTFADEYYQLVGTPTVKLGEGRKLPEDMKKYVPTRANYKFAGWYTTDCGTNITGAQKVEAGQPVPEGVSTLYAGWIRTVVLDAEPGSFKGQDQNYTRTVELPDGCLPSGTEEPVFNIDKTKQTVEFVGWYTKKCEVTWTESDDGAYKTWNIETRGTKVEPGAKVEGVSTLYAGYRIKEGLPEQKKVEIYFDWNGVNGQFGHCLTSSRSYSSEEGGYKLTADDLLVRYLNWNGENKLNYTTEAELAGYWSGKLFNGYTFLGWADTEKATAANVWPGYQVRNGQSIYAVWTKPDGSNSWSYERIDPAAGPVKSLGIQGMSGNHNTGSMTWSEHMTRGASVRFNITTSPSRASFKTLTWTVTNQTSKASVAVVYDAVNGAPVTETLGDVKLTASGKSLAVEYTADGKSASGAAVSLTVSVQAANEDGKVVNGTQTAIAEFAHRWNSGVVTHEAETCGDRTVTEYTCSVCGASYETGLIKEHVYSSLVERGLQIINPTCTEPGSKQRRCLVCNELKKDDITVLPALGHKWITREITVCGYDGTVTESTCSVCGAVELSADVIAKEHVWEDHRTVDVEATCGQNGSSSIHCANCDAVKDSQVIKATGEHSWGQWQTVVAATSQAMGEQKRACTVCGNEEIKGIPMLPEESAPSGGGAGGGAAGGGGGGGGAPAPEEPESTPEPTPEPSPEPEPTAEPEQAGGLQKAENGKTYLVIDGENATGVQTVNGVNYYFSAVDGHMLTGGIVNAGGGKKYYADETGELQTGIQQDSKDNTYYFSAKDGHMLKNGIVNAGGGKKYLASSTGTLLTGVQTVNGKTYYFSTKDGHMMKNGWVNAGNGVSYKLDKNGVVIETKGL